MKPNFLLLSPDDEFDALYGPFYLKGQITIEQFLQDKEDYYLGKMIMENRPDRTPPESPGVLGHFWAKIQGIFHALASLDLSKFQKEQQ